MADNSIRQIVHSLKQILINNGRAGMGKLKNFKNQSVIGMWNTFGYTIEPSYEDYLLRYKRQDIAKRIIDANVNYTWKTMPIIVDDEEKEDRETETEFELAIYDFFLNFKVSQLFKKADRLCCIGKFSVIVIGTSGESLEEPLGTYSNGLDSLVFLNVYSESQVKIKSYITDTTDSRYGKPNKYEITPTSIDEQGQIKNQTKYIVDSSRIIHIADETIDSELYGIPKLQPVINLLDDLLKVCGGSAEMFWLSAYQGLAFEVQEGYDLSPDDAKKLEGEIENYVNKAQRFMKLKGVNVKPVGSSVADPRGNFDTIIFLISGASNIPKRILLGSEQGQLAASVDQDTFFSYIQSRRNGFATENVIRELLDRMILCGILPTPKDETYTVEWEALFELTEQEKLNAAKTRIEAIKIAAPFGEVTELITGEEVRTSLGLLPDKPKTNFTFNESNADLEELPNEDDTTDDEVV